MTLILSNLLTLGKVIVTKLSSWAISNEVIFSSEILEKLRKSKNFLINAAFVMISLFPGMQNVTEGKSMFFIKYPVVLKRKLSLAEIHKVLLSQFSTLEEFLLKN
jgi:hypothetical protein